MPRFDIDNVRDFTDKAALIYFLKESDKKVNKPSLHADKKRNLVKKAKQNHLIYSALLGVLGVLLLYLPINIYPEAFYYKKITLPFINYEYKLSFIEIIYGLILVGIEIFLLIKADIKIVSKIASIYGYSPSLNINEPEAETIELVNIGLGKDRKKFTELGINPYQNFSRISLFMLRAMFIIKAFLSNFIFRIVIQKILGRIAIRSVTDFAGIPIYAFWNAYSASIIIRRADMRMHAQELMYKTGEHFHEKYKDNPKFKNLIYDTIEFVAITKKNFYPTDYLFAKHFLKLFDIPIKKEHRLSENYIEKIKNSDDNIKEAIGKIMILAFLIDGKLGTLEKRTLKKLGNKKVIPFNITQIKKWTKEYVSGKGFEGMLNF